jgi:transposase-like protein
MTRPYSLAFKQKLVEQLTGKNALNASQLSRQTGIRQQNLSWWLDEARVEARQARVLLDKQQNPMAVRRAALAEERQKGLFKTLCEDWYRAEVQARELKHPAVPRRYLDRYLLPKLGRFPASDITPADVARLLDELKVRAPTAANDLLRFTRRIFAFGVRRRFLPSNPAADFSPRLDAGGTERARSRA